MAKIMNLGHDTDIAWLTNVSFPVGPGCFNLRDDVLLVQIAINRLLAHFVINDPKGDRITAYLHRDGLFGSRTADAILGYQKNVKSRGYYIVPDGRIDPAPVSGWTPSGNAQYTIVYLNRDNRNVYGKMMLEEDFPPELQRAIKRNSPNF
ncbi:MAG TPA: hypothetical protein VLV88_00885 [Terriglobales bacterium]|nr:hypothetical protein [Terriglobales bacterium]